eukprot:GFUD01010953.1.p1 GENE.GFUD01010953.1~~GFUD01010953.1.p1  ORF type:complete len:166 (-),score=43.80 GFUD01010953.1:177-674(-)
MIKVFVFVCLVSPNLAFPPFIPSGWNDWIPDFSDFIPSFIQPSSGIKMEVIDVNTQSASVNCSWAGSATGNLTWLVDGSAPELDTVQEGEGGASSLINLVWEKMGKNPGDMVLLSCSGQSAGKTNGTGAWVSASQMMETITVPGQAADGNSSGESEGRRRYFRRV